MFRPSASWRIFPSARSESRGGLGFPNTPVVLGTALDLVRGRRSAKKEFFGKSVLHITYYRLLRVHPFVIKNPNHKGRVKGISYRLSSNSDEHVCGVLFGY